MFPSQKMSKVELKNFKINSTEYDFHSRRQVIGNEHHYLTPQKETATTSLGNCELTPASIDVISSIPSRSGYLSCDGESGYLSAVMANTCSTTKKENSHPDMDIVMTKMNTNHTQNGIMDNKKAEDSNNALGTTFMSKVSIAAKNIGRISSKNFKRLKIVGYITRCFTGRKRNKVILDLPYK